LLADNVPVRNEFAGFRGAVAFLTILPVPGAVTAPSGAVFAWFPLVGLAIGILLALVSSLPINPGARAFAVLVAWVLVTGGLHLDGWADCCDGLGATASAERRLQIMKDPRAGSWAIAGVTLLLLGKWIALRALAPVWLVAAPVAGRWAMVLAAAWLPLARRGGTAVAFRANLERKHIFIASLSALTVFAVLGAMASGWIWIAGLFAPVVALTFGWWAAWKLGGGITGDVYGAICELTELACLWAWMLWASG
jgi:adenosylcobinamide-GDP ribazoletransferase